MRAIRNILISFLAGLLALGSGAVALAATYAYEDFANDYTIVDANSKLSVTSTKVTFTLINGNNAAYVYKDWGVDQFESDFEFRFDFNCTYTTAGATGPAFFVLADEQTNPAGGYYDNIMNGANVSAIYMYLNNPSTPNEARVYLCEAWQGADYETYHTITKGTTYYVTVWHDSATSKYSAGFYTDPERTTASFTLQLTQHGAPGFEYNYAFMYREQVLSQTYSGYVENMVIVSGGGPVYWDPDEEAWVFADVDEDTGLYTYTDEDGNVYVWIDDEWVFVATATSTGHDIVELKDTIQESTETAMALWGMDNPGGRILVVLILGIIVFYIFRKNKMLQSFFCSLVAICGLTWGWIDTAIMIPVAVVFAVVIAGMFTGKIPKPWAKRSDDD